MRSPTSSASPRPPGTPHTVTLPFEADWFVQLGNDDASAAYETATRLELPIELEPRREEWGQLHFITRDPGGVAVDVVEVIPVTSAAIAAQYVR